MSAAGIAQIACVMGSCTAGGAYVPAMSDETRHRARPGDDLPRRPAAGEGGDRRGDQRRGTGRRRHARPPLGRRRPRRRQRRRTRWRSSASIDRPTWARGAARRRSRPRAAPPAYDPAELYGIIPTDVRAPYEVREVIARHRRRLASSTSSRRSTARRWSCGFARIWGYPVAILANNGVLFSESALKGAHFIELACQRGIPLRVPAEHLRLHGRRQVRGRRHRQGRRQAGHRGRLRRGPEVHRAHRRLVRRRQLRHVRPRLFAALPVHLAQQPDQRHGRRAGGQRAGHHPPRRRWRRAARRGRRRRRRPSRRRSASATRPRATPTTPPPGCGTTASSIRSRPATCSASPSPPASTRRSRRRASAFSGCSLEA